MPSNNIFSIYQIHIAMSIPTKFILSKKKISFPGYRKSSSQNHLRYTYLYNIFKMTVKIFFKSVIQMTSKDLCILSADKREQPVYLPIQFAHIFIDSKNL